MRLATPRCGRFEAEAGAMAQPAHQRLSSMRGSIGSIARCWSEVDRRPRRPKAAGCRRGRSRGRSSVLTLVSGAGRHWSEQSRRSRRCAHCSGCLGGRAASEPTCEMLETAVAGADSEGRAGRAEGDYQSLLQD
jgi:hypothetical protein